MKTLAFLIALLLAGAQVALADNFTISGTIKANALTLTNPVTVVNGGTGIASYTTGDILTASGSTTLSKLSDVATGSVLVSGGSGASPIYTSAPTISGNLTAASFLTGSSTYGPTGAILNGGLSATTGAFTGKVLGAEGGGTTNGFAFAEPSNDTGMFSPSDGVADLYANGTKEVDVQATGVTLYSGLTGTTGSFSSLTLTSTPLAVSSGGNGTASPSFTSGTNTTVSGSWPAQAVNVASAPTFSGLITGNGGFSGTTGVFSSTLTSPSLPTVSFNGTFPQPNTKIAVVSGVSIAGATTTSPISLGQTFLFNSYGCSVTPAAGGAIDPVYTTAKTTTTVELVNAGSTGTVLDLICIGV